MNGKALSALFSRVSIWMLASLVVLLCSAAPIRAQVDAGSISGTVTDASGGTISGVSVTLTNQGTNAALTTTTGSDGSYKFSPVRIGSYKLKASLQGFQAVEQAIRELGPPPEAPSQAPQGQGRNIW